METTDATTGTVTSTAPDTLITLDDVGAAAAIDIAHATADLADPAFPLTGAVDLDRVEPEPAVLELLSRTTARTRRCLPMRLDDEGQLVIAMLDPDDDVLVGRLSTEAGLPVAAVKAAPAQLARAIHRAYPPIKDIELTGSQEPDEADAARTLRLLLAQAVGDRASDVHLEPRPDGMQVRMRIDGRLRTVATLPEQMHTSLLSHIKVMAGLNILEHRRYQDGSLQAAVDDASIDVRVSVAPTTCGEKAVLRLLDRSWARLPLSRLGMDEQVHDAVRDTVSTPYGMLLCVGPTGAGKTTTLYAVLSEVSGEDVNVTTIEDPVEYHLDEANQTQVDPGADVDFASGLRGILRQDPDVILVGEVRDAQTAAIAVQASLSGHLVLSSFHATDAAGALFRLAEMGTDPATIATAVRGIVAQRLVRRVCPACAAPRDVTDRDRQLLAGLAPGAAPPEQLLEGEGCARCAQTGFDGQLGVFELLRLTPQLHQQLAAGATRPQLRSGAIEQGMRPLSEAAADLVLAGMTTLEEAVREVGVPDPSERGELAPTRCRGTTREGRRCRNRPTAGPYCQSHVPAEPVEPAQDDGEGEVAA